MDIDPKKTTTQEAAQAQAAASGEDDAPTRRGSFSRRMRKRMSAIMRRVIEPRVVAWACNHVPGMPREKVVRIANRIGSIAYRLSSKKVVRANMDVVFGKPKTRAERKARKELMKAAYCNAILVIMDCFWFSRDSRERIRKYVKCDDYAEALSHGTEPCIAITGHLGCWEMSAQAICLNGRTVTSVYAPIGSDATQALMERMRKANGQNVVARRGAVISLLRALREGQIVGLLLDQRTRINQGGVWVDFMGLKTSISNVAGLLSVRCRVKVSVVFCRSIGNGHYSLEKVDELPADHGLTDLEVTQWIATKLGDAIRAHPEQWLWNYRRWRHVPPGEDPAKYPFYALAFNPLVD